MSTEAPETGANAEAAPEAADQANADLQLDTSTDTEAVDVDVDGLDDAAFEDFINGQLDGSYGEAPVTKEVESTEDTSDDGTTEDVDTSDSAETEDVTEAETVTETPDANGYTFNIDGQEISVTDEADIKQLVERGLQSAVETKKNMPAQQLQQMLANNKLTEPDQLNLLMDVANGDPAAIRKLIKDKGIDPYDLASKDGDSDEAEDYKPKDHSVDQKTIALNKELDSLQESEHFSTTADVVMEQWDATSRQEFMDNPRNFTILNNQVADGSFEVISNEMKKLDLMGKLPAGKTQFELYRAVGDMLHANNALPGQKAPVEKTAPVDKSQPTAEQRLQAAAQQNRKRAVAPTRSAPTQTKTNQQVEAPEAYAGSDAEFLKRTEHLFNSM